jgi:hypothetical protein
MPEARFRLEIGDFIGTCIFWRARRLRYYTEPYKQKLHEISIFFEERGCANFRPRWGPEIREKE